MEALIYFALWGVVIFLLMRLGCGRHVMGHGHPPHGQRNAAASRSGDQTRWVPPETDVDPVCGKTVRTYGAKSSVYDGTVYYFCSAEHRETFEAAPHRYAGAKAEQQPTHAEHTNG